MRVPARSILRSVFETQDSVLVKSNRRQPQDRAAIGEGVPAGRVAVAPAFSVIIELVAHGSWNYYSSVG